MVSSTQTLTAKTFTKTFPLNYFGMTLLTHTNPNAIVNVQPKSAAKSVEQIDLKADVRGGKLLFTVPERGLYKVGIYTTGGKKVFESNAEYAGATSIGMQTLPAGVYVVQCTSPKFSLVKQVAVKR